MKDQISSGMIFILLSKEKDRKNCILKTVFGLGVTATWFWIFVLSGITECLHC